MDWYWWAAGAWLLCGFVVDGVLFGTPPRNVPLSSKIVGSAMIVLLWPLMLVGMSALAISDRRYRAQRDKEWGPRGVKRNRLAELADEGD